MVGEVERVHRAGAFVRQHMDVDFLNGVDVISAEAATVPPVAVVNQEHHAIGTVGEEPPRCRTCRYRVHASNKCELGAVDKPQLCPRQRPTIRVAARIRPPGSGFDVRARGSAPGRRPLKGLQHNACQSPPNAL